MGVITKFQMPFHSTIMCKKSKIGMLENSMEQGQNFKVLFNNLFLICLQLDQYPNNVSQVR
jgi:hypothetical protein